MSNQKLLEKKIKKYTKLNEKSTSQKYIKKINKYEKLLDEELEKEFKTKVGDIPKYIKKQPVKDNFVLQLEKELEDLNMSEQRELLKKFKTLKKQIKKDNIKIKNQIFTQVRFHDFETSAGCL